MNIHTSFVKSVLLCSYECFSFRNHRTYVSGELWSTRYTRTKVPLCWAVLDLLSCLRCAHTTPSPTTLLTVSIYYYQLHCPVPYSRILLEKLTISHLFKNFPTFYVTRKFSTVFKKLTNNFYSELNKYNSSPQSNYFRSALLLSTYLPLNFKLCISFTYCN